MTVITKASETIAKTDLILPPVVHNDVINMDREGQCCKPRKRIWVYRLQCNCLLLFLSFLMTMVVLLMATAAIFVISSSQMDERRSYSGFCTIPLDDLPSKSEMKSVRVGYGPISWQTEPLPTSEGKTRKQALAALFEHIDINNDIEKVSLVTDDQRVDFIHDFNVNVSGIVDPKRCFVMPLNEDMVLRPDVFLVNILRGAEFDVRRANARLRALLPSEGATGRLSHTFAESCVDKPIYQLVTIVDGEVEKRAADDQPTTYTHFAGKCVWDIDIHNIHQLEEHEAKA